MRIEKGGDFGYHKRKSSEENLLSALEDLTDQLGRDKMTETQVIEVLESMTRYYTSFHIFNRHGDNSKNSIAIVWNIEDVQSILEDGQEDGYFKDLKLTDKDCMDILTEIELRHDSSQGVCSDTIWYYLHDLVKERKEEV
jgi:hypothetical protein